MAGDGDLRGFLRALQPQLPLALALTQIAEGPGFVGAEQRLPWIRGSGDRVLRRRGDLGAVGRDGQLRVRAQIRSDLLGLRFLDIQLVREQVRIVLIEAVADLVMAIILLPTLYVWAARPGDVLPEPSEAAEA